MSRTDAVTLVAADGARFSVVGGATCIDFLYTGGLGERARWETLHSPHDLAAWASASQLIRASIPPEGVEVGPADLAEAIALREVLWRSINRLADGQPVAEADVDALNVVAARPDLAPRLSAGVVAVASPVTAARVLASVARDAVALVGGPLAGRVRRCAADDCALVFVDTSRPGARRWCAMSRCGNRDKARTRRRRESRT
ncbi:CGNR zinc finger domain-containing protein [Rhodococcus maanshanensis]|uniref:Conserved protein containing a Zn-ribbon-like motif, possibly RNA-binding n=1 Tax=Rhodococcus maanshanensis TaxID=183556 RepID=A0A1H7JXB5_9NOCA|nr:ABATE domain-containing protein [Rhodococcus maanshanensis]SEK79228.1 Conserved protein containing a Zn-ribbon-like motif, possibly RNA-binding [Rhodococcus maanshanensis]